MKKKTTYIIILALLTFAAGFSASYFFFGNNAQNSSHSHDEETLYTCGMHPQILEKEPGNCPICGMKLEPVKSGGSKKTNGERKILYWRAPMNPNEIYDHPGKSKMGMDLVPVYEDESQSEGVVTVDGSVLQSMNVRMESVTRKDLALEVSTYGTLEPDENKVFTVTSKFEGWIEKLYVTYEGAKVSKGSALAKIYSPMVASAEQEVISILKNNSSSSLLQNSVRKLRLLGVPEREIKRLLKTKKANDTFTLYSKYAGTVQKLNVKEGEKFSPKMPLFVLSDLSSLWLLAEIYETDLPKIKIGDEAEIVFPYLPGEKFSGKISFIYPTLSVKTRTAKARIELKNKDNKLMPKMFADVTIKSQPKQNALVVPETAVIRSGKHNIVILSLGEGKFKPTEIRLGIYSDGYYEVLSGINENDVIVTTGEFMIDSESNLRAAINLFTSQKEEATAEKSHEGMPEMNMEKSAAEKTETSENSIVREGIIDVSAIDENGDGKVFQDSMDWNVISDKPGRCPLCGMYLQEFTIEEAERNIAEHGFKYKRASVQTNKEATK